MYLKLKFSILCKWVEEFSILTVSKWNVRSLVPKENLFNAS